MYLRSFAITISLAAGLLVILALAFVMGIPAYVITLVNPHQPRTRFAPALPSGRLSRS